MIYSALALFFVDKLRAALMPLQDDERLAVFWLPWRNEVKAKPRA